MAFNYGRAFEALLERFAGLAEEAAVVFPDGESGCSADWGDKLRGAGKRLWVAYLVYLAGWREKEVSSPLDRFATDRAVLTLNGWTGGRIPCILTYARFG
jgi:hypothetical protein